MGTSDLPRWTEVVGKLGTDCSRSASEVGGSLVGLSPSAVGSALPLVTVRIELNPRTRSWLLEGGEGTRIPRIRSVVSVVVVGG